MEIVQEIKNRVAILDVVGELAQLKKTGNAYKANCPFHAEKTPSFVVNPQRGTWRCYGACNEGGNLFNFVMRSQNVGFGEALRQLARRAGIDYKPTKAADTNAKLSARQRIHHLNQLATDWFQTYLKAKEGAGALKYLAERAITADVAKRHGIGFAPSGIATLKEHLRAKGIADSDILEARLATASDDAGLKDFFSERITFEIRDRHNQIVGFGARSLAADAPKYINTPATLVFNKSEILYGIHTAHSPIAQKQHAIIVEGYTDVIAAHENGFGNVVATMGVALSQQHLETLKSLVGRDANLKITLCLDADQAGQDATLSNLENIFEYASAHKIELDVARLAGGKDPDELIRNDPTAWRSVLADVVPALAFMTQFYVRQFDVQTSAGVEDVVKKIVPFISSVRDDYVRDRWIQNLASELQIDEHALFAFVPRFKKRPANRNTNWKNAPSTPSVKKENVSSATLKRTASRHLEDYLLKLLLECDYIRDTGEQLDKVLFDDSVNAEIFEIWCSRVLSDTTDLEPAVSERLAEIRQLELPPGDDHTRLTEFNACVSRLKERQLKQSIKMGNALLTEAEGAEHIHETLQSDTSELNDIYRAREAVV